MLRCVAQIAQEVSLPISGIGGVSTWEHAVEMMMLGATTVQIGTAILWKGYGVVGEIIRGIEAFMNRQGYQSPNEFIGAALKHLVTTESMAMRPPVVPQLNASACVGCGVCKTVCGYDAVRIHDRGAPSFQAENCDGCGLCVEMCPACALRLVQNDAVVPDL
jgi:ferredoxin